MSLPTTSAPEWDFPAVTDNNVVDTNSHILLNNTVTDTDVFISTGDVEFNSSASDHERIEPVANWPISDDKPFHSLDLPGELRDKIYAFAVEPDSGKVIQRAHDCDKFGCKDHWPWTSCNQEYRQFLPLARVNCQIRTEFMPIWRDNTIHHVHLKDVNDYIDTFFWSENVEDELVESYSDNIEIQYSTRGDGGKWPGKRHMMDAFPLMQLSSRAPNLKIESIERLPDGTLAKPDTATRSGEIISTFGALFSKSLPSLLTWATTKTHAVTHVFFNFDFSPMSGFYKRVPDIVICFRDVRAPEWSRTCVATRRAAGRQRISGLVFTISEIMSGWWRRGLGVACAPGMFSQEAENDVIVCLSAVDYMLQKREDEEEE
jgi:hypothetical protein